MFANRFTAFIDACSLAGALKRNLLLSLAEAEFFRLRLSAKVLDETELAIASILAAKLDADSRAKARRARLAIEAAFEEAIVDGYEHLLSIGPQLPDAGDAHVVAAAVKTKADMIITENLRHFPENVLAPLNIAVRSADAFIADTIDLDPGRAVPAIRKMRLRFRRPELTEDELLNRMDAEGLVLSVDLLRQYVMSV